MWVPDDAQPAVKRVYGWQMKVVDKSLMADSGFSTMPHHLCHCGCGCDKAVGSQPRHISNGTLLNEEGKAICETSNNQTAYALTLASAATIISQLESGCFEFSTF
jgi:hypothetical protein